MTELTPEELVVRARVFAKLYGEMFDDLDDALVKAADIYFTRLKAAAEAENRAARRQYWKFSIPVSGATTWSPGRTDEVWVWFTEIDYEGDTENWQIPWLAITDPDTAVAQALARRREFQINQDEDEKRMFEQATGNRIAELETELARLRAEQEK